MRSKEDSHDYRYFPEPDLPPAAGRRRRGSSGSGPRLPELPAARRERYARSLGLSAYDAAVIVADPVMSTAFEAIRARRPGPAGQGDREPRDRRLRPDRARTARRADRGRSRRVGDRRRSSPTWSGGSSTASCRGRTPARSSRSTSRAGRPVGAIVDDRGLRQISDDVAPSARSSTRSSRANPKAVADYRAGKPTIGFLVGQVMKATRGQANAALVQAAVRDRLELEPGESGS